MPESVPREPRERSRTSVNHTGIFSPSCDLNRHPFLGPGNEQGASLLLGNQERGKSKGSRSNAPQVSPKVLKKREINVPATARGFQEKGSPESGSASGRP